MILELESRREPLERIQPTIIAGIISSALPAIIGAAGSIGGGILGAQGAKAAAQAGKPRRQTIPIPPYAQALQEIVARTIAANINAQPPSFADYVKSGGRETFPITNAGMTPGEEVQLGMVSKGGMGIPMRDPNTGAVSTGPSLTPAQALFIGHSRKIGGGNASDPLVALFQNYSRASALRSKIEGGTANAGQIRRYNKAVQRYQSGVSRFGG